MLVSFFLHEKKYCVVCMSSVVYTLNIIISYYLTTYSTNNTTTPL